MATQAITFTPNKLLRNALKANSIFCLSSGLLMLIAAGIIAEFLGIEDTAIIGSIVGRAFVRIIGVGLIPYAVMLFMITRQPVIRAEQGWMVVIGDLMWVIGSIILVVSGWLPLTIHGQWGILLVMDIVLVFAITQFIGIRKLRPE